MTRKLSRFIVAAIVWSVGACGTANDARRDSAADAKSDATKKDEPDAAVDAVDPALLDPFSATEQAPAVFRARFETTEGAFVIETTRAWAPLGADRFYNLVKLGYYDGVGFFRAIKGFMVQFGLHGEPAVTRAWRAAPIKDDPVTQSNKKGTVTFANSGANTRTTQIFINYNDNTPLDAMGFAPFGKVVEGMDVVERLHTGYGEGAPKGSGPDQVEIEREGNPYLRRRFPELDYVQRATIE